MNHYFFSDSGDALLHLPKLPVAGSMRVARSFSAATVNSGRLFWLAGNWTLILRRFAYSYHFALFSACGVGWLVIIRFLSRASAEALPAGVTLLGLLFLMPISDDPTRVFAIVSFPLLCVLLLRNAEFLATIPRETIGLLALLWCLVPWIFAWAGRPIVSAAAYHLLAALH